MNQEKLRALQDVLLQLKQDHGKQLHLRKAAAGSSPHAPFPITLSLVVSAPATAFNYDVDSVTVKLELPHTFLQDPNSLKIGVVSSDLPDALQRAIARKLADGYKKEVAAGQDGWKISSVFQHMTQQWIPLISCIPQCLEQYEAVNTAGATIRRYAIVTPAEDILKHIEESLFPASSSNESTTTSVPQDSVSVHQTSAPVAQSHDSSAAAQAHTESNNESIVAAKANRDSNGHHIDAANPNTDSSSHSIDASNPNTDSNSHSIDAENPHTDSNSHSIDEGQASTDTHSDRADAAKIDTDSNSHSADAAALAAVPPHAQSKAACESSSQTSQQVQLPETGVDGLDPDVVNQNEDKISPPPDMSEPSEIVSDAGDRQGRTNLSAFAKPFSSQQTNTSNANPPGHAQQMHAGHNQAVLHHLGSEGTGEGTDHSRQSRRTIQGNPEDSQRRQRDRGRGRGRGRGQDRYEVRGELEAQSAIASAMRGIRQSNPNEGRGGASAQTHTSNRGRGFSGDAARQRRRDEFEAQRHTQNGASRTAADDSDNWQQTGRPNQSFSASHHNYQQEGTAADNSDNWRQAGRPNQSFSASHHNYQQEGTAADAAIETERPTPAAAPTRGMPGRGGGPRNKKAPNTAQQPSAVDASDARHSGLDTSSRGMSRQGAGQRNRNVLNKAEPPEQPSVVDTASVDAGSEAGYSTTEAPTRSVSGRGGRQRNKNATTAAQRASAVDAREAGHSTTETPTRDRLGGKGGRERNYRNPQDVAGQQEEPPDPSSVSKAPRPRTTGEGGGKGRRNNRNNSAHSSTPAPVSLADFFNPWDSRLYASAGSGRMEVGQTDRGTYGRGRAQTVHTNDQVSGKTEAEEEVGSKPDRVGAGGGKSKGRVFDYMPEQHTESQTVLPSEQGPYTQNRKIQETAQGGRIGGVTRENHPAPLSATDAGTHVGGMSREKHTVSVSATDAGGKAVDAGMAGMTASVRSSRVQQAARRPPVVPNRQEVLSLDKELQMLQKRYVGSFTLGVQCCCDELTEEDDTSKDEVEGVASNLESTSKDQNIEPRRRSAYNTLSCCTSTAANEAAETAITNPATAVTDTEVQKGLSSSSEHLDPAHAVVETGSVRSWQINLSPTDPDWGVNGALQLHGSCCSQCYPAAGSAQIHLSVLSPLEPRLRERVAASIKQQLQSGWGRPKLLTNILRSLENYAGSLAAIDLMSQPPTSNNQPALHPVSSRDVRESRNHDLSVTASAAGNVGKRLPKGHPAGGDGKAAAGRADDGDLWDVDGAEYSSSEESESESDSLDESESSGDEGLQVDEGEAVGAEGGFSASGQGGDVEVAGGYSVVLEGLQLDQVAVMEVVRPTVQVVCSRCSTSSSFTLSSDPSHPGGRPFESQAPCAGCHQTLTLLMRPKFIHASNNILGSLKPTGCRPMDLLPSVAAVQCGECSAVCALRGWQVGMTASRKCSSCHREIGLLVSAVSFVPRKAPGTTSSTTGVKSRGPVSQKKKLSNPFDGTIQLGQPLPHMGACKHYRHSYRWLRFPCCGMRFPCDLCHEEYTDGHEVKWASRMVCGFCSLEQSVAEKCSSCARKLACGSAHPTGRNTRFWEGGEGCRDKSKMSRRDPHRYRNSAAKTKSAKANRVGPKPWSKGGAGVTE